MFVAPRALLIAASILALTMAPTAVADDCVEVVTSYFGDGLRVIASAQNTIAIGLVSGMPGDGFRTVVVVSPSLCGGVGVGVGASSTDPAGLLGILPPALPLP